MKHYLGIDVGGTNTKWVIVEAPNFQVKHFKSFPTPKTKSEFLKLLARLILESKEKQKLAGIGVGLPGIVDPKRGVLVRAPHLSFLNNWDAKKFFSKFHVPSRFENDSRCFVRAEAKLGAGKGKRNVVGLTIGTGVGGGIFLNGEVYSGAHFGAGEFGHMIIDGQHSLDTLGGKHTLLSRTAQNKSIAIGVANIINALDPDVVVLGGGGVTEGFIDIPVVSKAARAYIMSPMGKKTSIVKAKLGSQAQAIGATLLFR